MKHYDTVIFDLDGTLLDTIEDLANSLNHTLAQFDVPTLPVPTIQSYVGNGLRRLLELSIPEGLDHPKFEDIFTTFRDYYIDHCKEATAPYPGIMDLLEKLREKKIPMAIVSNKNDTAVKELAVDFFDGLISVAIGEREGISKKPAPDTVFAALKELDCSSFHAVYVGDSEVDLQTAANSGMDCITVSWGFKGRAFLEKEGASTIIDTPEELLDFFI
ncbi:MAG: HAD family hydrolase [Lachnospiraceae bacterium]|nr:HAD family hydrolase [Lachnospiraceae bacterium]